MESYESTLTGISLSAIRQLLEGQNLVTANIELRNLISRKCGTPPEPSTSIPEQHPLHSLAMHFVNRNFEPNDEAAQNYLEISRLSAMTLVGMSKGSDSDRLSNGLEVLISSCLTSLGQVSALSKPQALLSSVGKSFEHVAHVLGKHRSDHHVETVCELAMHYLTGSSPPHPQPPPSSTSTSTLSERSTLNESAQAMAHSLSVVVNWAHSYKVANAKTLPSSLTAVLNHQMAPSTSAAGNASDAGNTPPIDLVMKRCFECSCVLSPSSHTAWFALASFALSLSQNILTSILYAFQSCQSFLSIFLSFVALKIV